MNLSYSDHHSWIDRKHQVIKEEMPLSYDESLHVCACVEHSQKTSQRDVTEQELVRMKRIQSHQTLDSLI